MKSLPHSTGHDDRLAYRSELMKTLDVNPQFAPAYVELAKFHAAQGDPTQALRMALKAEKLEPWRGIWYR